MIIERDAGIEMGDGLVLRANIYRPDRGAEKFPVIMALGPYCKGIRFQEGHHYAESWKNLIAKHPEIGEGSTCSYMTWETTDPERWVPYGYVVIQVDSRGSGRSPGYQDIFSPREVRDYYNCIEWAGIQPWSNGKVGLLGISYYAMNQWLVASLQPPHLAAIIPWEGATDHYRDFARVGGILVNGFMEFWYYKRVVLRQHGSTASGEWDSWLNEPPTGPKKLPERELLANRADYVKDITEHTLYDEFYRSRSANLKNIVVPLISAANWGAQGLMGRGNFEGFVESSSKEKWLEVHVGRHEESFYLPYALDIQRRFFDHYLKGIANGWEKELPVILTIRHPDNRFEQRREKEWPIDRTRWTKIYLDGSTKTLTWNVSTTAASFSFEALGDDVTLFSPPLTKETEITGPLAARLFISSSTTDADLFLTFRAYSPDGREVDFQGSQDPHTPLAQGCLRASHRRLDQAKSKPYQPYHTHDEIRKLRNGEISELDVEIWPTCIVLPASYRFALTVGGKDFERSDTKGQFRGSGPFLHNAAKDRPEDVYGGTTRIHTGGETKSYLLLPIIPSL